jgi:hypothetical protein
MSEPHMTTETLESLHESLTLLYCIVHCPNEYNDEDIQHVERALNFVLDVIDYRKHK